MVNQRMKTAPSPTSRIMCLPTEWAKRLGVQPVVLVEQKGDGVFLRSVAPLSWDDIFAVKLRPALLEQENELLEVSYDDLLF